MVRAALGYLGGPKREICGNVGLGLAEKRSDACLIFRGKEDHLLPVQTTARRTI